LGARSPIESIFSGVLALQVVSYFLVFTGPQSVARKFRVERQKLFLTVQSVVLPKPNHSEPSALSGGRKWQQQQPLDQNYKDINIYIYTLIIIYQ
jgi:hypothetical protein